MLGLAAVAGAVLLVVAEFAPIYEIKVLTVVKESYSGYHRHSIALALLALAGVAMAIGAVRRGSRPAALALATLGAAALLIAVALDVPDVHETGQLPERYESAVANPAVGLYLETLGGALLVMAGGGLMVLGGPPPARAFHRPRPTRRE